jgi:hypothetical protein
MHIFGKLDPFGTYSENFLFYRNSVAGRKVMNEIVLETKC